jgi:fucose permease
MMLVGRLIQVLSAATAGVAVVPSVAGLVSDRLGLVAIGPVIACCALVLLLLHERLVAITERPLGDDVF